MSFISKSASKASEPSLARSALSAAAVSVKSNCGLTWFDYPINHKNKNKVVSALDDFKGRITAVWLVARPVAGDVNGGFMHWYAFCVVEGSDVDIPLE